MGEPRIQLQDVDKFYYSETIVTHALRKVNLSFGMNEFVAITGESGSGKSTLLKIISGMEGFEAGEMFVDGQPTAQYDDDEWERYRREKVGYIFQDYSLIGHYSVRDNVVSTLLIMGMGYREAVQQADRYLARVGLQGMEKKKASKLSSGQKQRLSIARALSKGTDIIVADEPTGNLDSETGEQIVRLLNELSGDHLVIMVTHNYEQVKAYATRRICLHDGALVEDMLGNHGEMGMSDKSDNVEPSELVKLTDTETADVSDKSDNREPTESGAHTDARTAEMPVNMHRYIRRVASFLARRNIRTQWGQAFLFVFFLFTTAVISFLFIGKLLMYADDRITKVYDPRAFGDEEMNRIVVKHPKYVPMTEEDLDAVRQIKHVVTVDQYDNVNDVSYYYRENEDYEYQYGYSDFKYESESGENEDYEYESESVVFLDDSHFMRSTTCISEQDLLAGALPQKRDGVVMYSPDGEAAIGTTFTCFFKNPSIWGPDEFIRKEMRVIGVLREPSEQVYFSPALCQMMTAQLNAIRYIMHFHFDPRLNDFLGRDELLPLISEELRYNEMQASIHYQAPVDRWRCVQLDEIPGGGGRDYMEIYQYDSDRKMREEPIEFPTIEMYSGKRHTSSRVFLAMSEDAFMSFNDINTYQMSAYITSYAKTTEVLEALREAGYEAVSTYQISVKEYDPEKVHDRLVQIIIAVAVLLVMLLAEILILRSLFRLRVKDYQVLKRMGMHRKLVYRISWYEMGIYMASSAAIAIIVLLAARDRYPFLQEMLYYYELPVWPCYIVYNLLAVVLTVTAFNYSLADRID